MFVTFSEKFSLNGFVKIKDFDLLFFAIICSNELIDE